MILFIQNIFRFFLLTAVQVFVLNNIRFMGYINPYIYFLFFLLLPVRFPRWVLLLLAFAQGLLIDSFTNTPGIHAFAAVFIAYLRHPVILLFTSIEEGANPEPSFHSFGIAAFIKYIVVMVFFHHALFFVLEIFSFTDFPQTLLRIGINSLLSIFIILGIASFRKQ